LLSTRFCIYAHVAVCSSMLSVLFRIDPVSSPLLLFTAQIVAIMSVFLLAVGYLKSDPKSASARVFAVIALFVVFYLLNGMSGESIDPNFRINLSAIDRLIELGTSSVSGLFMIYCFLIFQEQQKFPAFLSLAFGLQVALELLFPFLRTAQNPIVETYLPFLAGALDVMQLLFVGFAIFWTLRGWRADLVDDRRILRWFIIGVQGALIFSVVFVENFLLEGGSANNASEQAVIVFAIALLTLTMLVVAMRFDLVSLSQAIRKVTELTEVSEPEGAPSYDVDSFNSVFKGGQMYREAGLTIAQLAKKLNLPEYRLRAFIHRELGFRNFNAMLHAYRVEEASLALADADKQSVPVLTIALSVGYQSITPFNNAFREIMGVTPSEYRKQQTS